MKVSNDISFSHNNACVVALGCFDGVHLGHVSVINTAIQKAKDMGLSSCVWSFAEPPKKFYSPQPVSVITDSKVKEELISDLGVDIYLSIPFNKNIASISPEDFFYGILIDKLKASVLVCGADFTFGKGGKGNINTLRSLCENNSVELISVPSVSVDSHPVSSSAIRTHLTDGNIDMASALLGRPYSIKTKVTKGKQLGKTLGFPTINQTVDKGICLPANGVYLTKVILDKPYHAITNIGTQPTVGGESIICETHIFDYVGDLYGQEVEVQFLKFIRKINKFSSIDELKSQIARDIKIAKNLI